jgi:3-oxoacyl-[acyl-carrier-protein] synthase-3
MGITGVGAAVPDRIVTNAELSRRVDTTHEWIVERTGIHERRIAAADEYTSDLATRAATIALDRAGVAPAAVDLVLVATSTPDAYFPSVAAVVADRIGAHAAAANDLSAACTGFVYALVSAATAIHSGLAQHVLVIGAETMSRILDWDDRGTCILFGDGAGAVVLSADAQPASDVGIELGSDGSRGDDLIVRAMRDRPNVIEMNGREVYKFATRVMVESVQRVLAATGEEPGDVDWLVPHQANVRIIDHAVKRLGLDPARVVGNLDRYGNTSAASIPICLDEAWADGRLQRGDRTLMVGFGGGLTWGSVLMNWAAEPCTTAGGAG